MQTNVDWVARIHPARLTAALAPIDPGADRAREMLAMPRLQHSIAALLGAHFGIVPPAAAPFGDRADAAVAMLMLDDWAALPRACGIAFWRYAMAHEIRHTHRAALQARLGADLFERVAAIDVGGPDLPMPATVDAFELAIERDGAGCVAAWLDVQSPDCAAWLALKAPHAQAKAEANRAAHHAVYGPAIVRAEAARSRAEREHSDA